MLPKNTVRTVSGCCASLVYNIYTVNFRLWSERVGSTSLFHHHRRSRGSGGGGGGEACAVSGYSMTLIVFESTIIDI